eukprot:TRINITY_DN79979_c0_g1_i1.p1 TRINITY_DN79979_c0_g1~~TRINITY_DN79979_c0_g1_i1.p1  ORF type:complete len:539 (-),score=129.61 TRINITY_DN79979_c0_g1_i1:392-1891(-)
MAAVDYVIVGAGPAGLAAAGFLAKEGVKVAVYEGRPRPKDVFGSYPVVLNARGTASLEKLDQAVADRAAEVGMPVKQLHVVPNNRTVAEVPTFGTGIMRDQASMILLESAESKPNISFYWDHKLAAIDFESHTLTFEKPDGSKVSTHAPRLVAADGNRSRVRRCCEAEVSDFSAVADPWGFQLRFMNAKGVDGQTVMNPDFHYVLGDKGYVCQQPNGIWSVSLRVLPESDEDFLFAEDMTESRLQQLKDYTKQYATAVHENLMDDAAYKSFYDNKAFDGLVVKCSCLNPAGWICLIGDAAHAVQPATGEGINSGLEDAMVLGDCIREHPDDPFAAFDAMQRPNAHALNVMALQARDKVVTPPPRTQVTNIMVTIGLGIGKKMGIIEGTNQDYMLGEKARTVGVKSYAELVEMEQRQTRVLRPVANGIAKIFRVPKENPPKESGSPLPASSGYPSQESQAASAAVADAGAGASTAKEHPKEVEAKVEETTRVEVEKAIGA